MTDYIERLRRLTNSEKMRGAETTAAGSGRVKVYEWSPKDLIPALLISQAIGSENDFSIIKAGRLGGLRTTELYQIDERGLRFQVVHFHAIEEEESGRHRDSELDSLRTTVISDDMLPEKSAQAFRDRAGDIIGDIERQLQIPSPLPK